MSIGAGEGSGINIMIFVIELRSEYQRRCHPLRGLYVILFFTYQYPARFAGFSSNY